MYLKEDIVPFHIKVLEKELYLMTVKDQSREFSSYVALKIDTMKSKKKTMINAKTVRTSNVIDRDLDEQLRPDQVVDHLLSPHHFGLPEHLRLFHRH